MTARETGAVEVRCAHLMHLPSGKCLGCGEQHQPLPDYKPGDDETYLADDSHPTPATVELDAATPSQIKRANAAVEANLNDDGSPKFDSAQGYACALTAIIQSDSRPQPTPATGEIVERVSETIYDFLDERFPDDAMPGGKQLFADDHLDAKFKHEAGCDEMAKAILEKSGIVALLEQQAATIAELREAWAYFVSRERRIKIDIGSAHKARGAAASDFMREDDADFRRELEAAFNRLRATLERTARQ